MRRLSVYIRRYWILYALGVFCTLTFAILQMILPVLMRDAVNAVPRGHLNRLVHHAPVMIALAAMMGVARAVSRAIIFNTGRDVEYDLRNDLFAHLTTLGPDFYERLKTGDLMSRLINDLTLIRMLFGMVVLS